MLKWGGAPVMRIVPVLSVLVASVSLSVASFAATVSPIEGQLSISSGQGYRSVTGPTPGAAGDVIIASPGGSGEIVYDDGCRIRVVPGGVVTVAAKSPCRDRMALGGSMKDSPVVEEPRRDYGFIAPLVAVGGTVGAVIYFATKGDDNGAGANPASP